MAPTPKQNGLKQGPPNPKSNQGYYTHDEANSIGRRIPGILDDKDKKTNIKRTAPKPVSRNNSQPRKIPAPRASNANKLAVNKMNSMIDNGHHQYTPGGIGY